MAMLATAKSSFYAASILIHPSMLTAEDFEKAQAPICLLLNKDEGEMKAEYEILKAKAFGDKCSYHFSLKCIMDSVCLMMVGKLMFRERVLVRLLNILQDFRRRMLLFKPFICYIFV